MVQPKYNSIETKQQQQDISDELPTKRTNAHRQATSRTKLSPHLEFDQVNKIKQDAIKKTISD